MNWLIKNILKFTGSQKFLSIQMDITNTCNLKCVHCYQPDLRGDELSFSSWQNILGQYSDLSEKLALKPCFSLSGGEPTLSPLFAPILNEIHSRWPAAVITIITNGTALSEKIISEIKLHGADVQLSLDGPDAERHDMVRGKGSFNKMTAGCSAAAGSCSSCSRRR